MKLFFTLSVTALLLTPALAKNLFKSSPKEKGGPKRDVTLTISSSKAAFAADESVLIDVTLKNNDPQKPARILDWVVPCDAEDDTAENDTMSTPTEMSFFNIKTMGDRAAKYTGALFKRAKPVEKDYKILKPGDQISCTIDLGKYYEFAAASDDNNYEIKYSVASLQLSNPDNNGNAVGQQVESLDSNTLAVKIDARDSPSRGHALRDRNLRQRSRGLQTGGTTFNRCTESEQSDLIQARSLALDASTEVVDHLTGVRQGSSSSECPRYDEWFNSYSSSRHNQLEVGYEEIRARLDDADVLFDCKCKKQYYAYVYPSSPYDIYLCRAFWSAGMAGTDSKLGTVIHEMSHFTVTANTDDFTYGQSSCRNLADSNPGNAINNADNHEYMAENTPNLACETGTPVPPPTNFPTTPPTKFPTNTPTEPQPTKSPTSPPTNFPTKPLTPLPTNVPTPPPTNFPTKLSTPPPTNNPTEAASIDLDRAQLVGAAEPAATIMDVGQAGEELDFANNYV
eukprot:CAMPEP_0201868906 /NCGR_PEP_ID=MMETSP0902-20130614/2607_1 /ASSEMBLY_ACC=CAM_ASM_000551 /TAXON_ID=420261 /ORGANISM="Thalassiosira antarctica, Strain CCMP982" /LENGTH=509 /DNA_ID=CAMNT_0048394307 /DNA_START=41 /DNA_END=1571 /DNA_ORIENTATION=+